MLATRQASKDAAMMPFVAFDTSKFIEKLRKLTEGKVLARVAAEAGLSRQSLSQYLAGSAPKPHTALLLAEALGVDPLWLIDERQDWIDPPPKRSKPLSEAGYVELFNELRKHYAKMAEGFKDALDKAEGQPWQHVAISILWHMGLKKSPEPIQAIANLAVVLYFYAGEVEELNAANPEGQYTPTYEPGRDMRAARAAAIELQAPKLMAQLEALEKENPGLLALKEYFEHTGEFNPLIQPEPTDHLSADEKLQRIQTDKFMAARVPYLLARLAVHPSVANNPQCEIVRRTLKEKGYIDVKGQPAEIPNFYLSEREPQTKRYKSRKKR